MEVFCNLQKLYLAKISLSFMDDPVAVLVRVPFHRNTKARLKLASLSNFKNFFQYEIVMGNQFAGCLLLK